MSRNYRINLSISDLKDRDECERVKQAIEADMPDDVYIYGDSIEADGDISLGGGKSEQEWAEEIAKAIWTVTKRPVDIQINWWYEDRSPDDTTLLVEDDFNEMFPALEQLAMAAEEESDG